MKLTTVAFGRWRVRSEKYGYVYWNRTASKAVKPNQILRQQSDELLIGKVIKTTTIGINQQPCAQVSVTGNEFNTVLNMYFPYVTNFWALDNPRKAQSNSMCSLGDVVLIRKLDEPFAIKVTHLIEKRVFEHGNVIDPVSGQRIFGTEYEDLRKVRSEIVKQVFGQRLTARQLAAARLAERKVEAGAQKH